MSVTSPPMFALVSLVILYSYMQLCVCNSDFMIDHFIFGNPAVEAAIKSIF